MEEAYLQVDLMKKMILRLMLYMKLLIREWMEEERKEGLEIKEY